MTLAFPGHIVEDFATWAARSRRCRLIVPALASAEGKMYQFDPGYDGYTERSNASFESDPRFFSHMELGMLFIIKFLQFLLIFIIHNYKTYSPPR
jgi:hypothetical protein